jgi:hypothetical protein
MLDMRLEVQEQDEHCGSAYKIQTFISERESLSPTHTYLSDEMQNV